VSRVSCIWTAGCHWTDMWYVMSYWIRDIVKPEAFQLHCSYVQMVGLVTSAVEWNYTIHFY